MKTFLRILAAGSAVLLAVCAANAADWTENYPSALAQAKKEHKLLLLDFTGSDWCIWCKRTDKEVFDTAKFKEYADKNLILVKVDFPEERKMPESVKAQNEGLKDKYDIQGFPTLIVLNPHEKVVYTQVGYKPGGPEALISNFASAN
ncbi:MAG TPA: thioredoxin family protein [Opitutaceae bacterium]|jgi:thioredoxin-related protein